MEKISFSINLHLKDRLDIEFTGSVGIIYRFWRISPF